MRIRARSGRIAAAVLLAAAAIGFGSAASAASPESVLADRRPLAVPGCNATTWWQIPDRRDVFVGRVLRDATARTACPGNDAWALVWGRMDWSANRIVSEGRIFDLPLKIENGSDDFTITSAYDPSVMVYRGEHWIAFECNGRNFRGSVAICMAPLTLERGIDPSRLYVAVEGVSHDGTDEAHASASVPKLLSLGDRAFLYWTSVRIRKADNTWLGLTVRGVELAADPATGRVVPKGFGPRMPANHPKAVEVMGPEPGGRNVDAYEIRRIGSDFYLFGSIGNCLVPTAGTPGCYRFTIRRSREPLGRHIFNRDRVADARLPANPVAYMRAMDTPDGRVRLLGQMLAPTTAGRAEPAGYASYALDLGAPDALFEPGETAEGVQRFVEKAYRAFLDRPADPAGLRANTRALEGGAEKRAVLAGLLLSPEARRTFGWERMDEAAFVRFLFQRVLGRAADPEGLRAWVAEIRSGKLDRETAIRRFFAAEEFALRRPDFL